MDSLTQIVLGAACGEAVAGRKIGNRALLWGAVGGTIPDLDVLATLFTDEITSTAFHRGFMHSFLFAVLAPWACAWLVQQFYAANIHRRKVYKLAAVMGDTLQNDNYVFRFLLYCNGQGEWDVRGKPGGEDDPQAARASFQNLWNRINGG